MHRVTVALFFGHGVQYTTSNKIQAHFELILCNIIEVTKTLNVSFIVHLMLYLAR